MLALMEAGHAACSLQLSAEARACMRTLRVESPILCTLCCWLLLVAWLRGRRSSVPRIVSGHIFNRWNFCSNILLLDFTIFGARQVHHCCRRLRVSRQVCTSTSTGQLTFEADAWLGQLSSSHKPSREHKLGVGEISAGKLTTVNSS